METIHPRLRTLRGVAKGKGGREPVVPAGAGPSKSGKKQLDPEQEEEQAKRKGRWKLSNRVNVYRTKKAAGRSIPSSLAKEILVGEFSEGSDFLTSAERAELTTLEILEEIGPLKIPAKVPRTGRTRAEVALKGKGTKKSPAKSK